MRGCLFIINYIHALSYREAIKIGSIGWVGIGLFLLRGKLRRF